MLDGEEEDGEADVSHHHHRVVKFETQRFEVVLKGLCLCLHDKVLARGLVSDSSEVVFHIKKLFFEFLEVRDLEEVSGEIAVHKVGEYERVEELLQHTGFRREAPDSELEDVRFDRLWVLNLAERLIKLQVANTIIELES